MSILKLTTDAKSVLNPAFSKLFLALAEDTEGSAHDIHYVDAVLNATTPDEIQDNKDISTMAEFMLITGCQMAYRENWTYHFGDVDLLDRIDDWSGLLVIQHELEDTSINLKDLYHTFKALNLQNKPVPLDDFTYYTDQIVNIYSVTAHEGTLWAEKLRLFDAFQTSGIDVPDISVYSDSWEGPDCPGRVYLPSDNNCGLVIADSSGWFNEDNTPVKWYLQLGNLEYASNSIEELELTLFDWAMSAGWCDKL